MYASFCCGHLGTVNQGVKSSYFKEIRYIGDSKLYEIDKLHQSVESFPETEGTHFNNDFRINAQMVQFEILSTINYEPL